MDCDQFNDLTVDAVPAIEDSSSSSSSSLSSSSGSLNSPVDNSRVPLNYVLVDESADMDVGE